MISFGLSVFEGADVDDEELLELLTETNNMSKKLEDYGKKKSSAITAAKRLGQFLLDDKLKEKGLVCAYVVSKVKITNGYHDNQYNNDLFIESRRNTSNRTCNTNSYIYS